MSFYTEWILLCYSDCPATASWVSTIQSSWRRRRWPTATTPSPTTWRRTSASPKAPTSSRASNSGIRYEDEERNPTSSLLPTTLCYLKRKITIPSNQLLVLSESPLSRVGNSLPVNVWNTVGTPDQIYKQKLWKNRWITGETVSPPTGAPMVW